MDTKWYLTSQKTKSPTYLSCFLLMKKLPYFPSQKYYSQE